MLDGDHLHPQRLSLGPKVSVTISSRTMRIRYTDLHSNHHNTFESYHRFIGWLGLAVSMTRLYEYTVC